MQTGDFYFGTFGENSSGTHNKVAVRAFLAERLGGPQAEAVTSKLYAVEANPRRIDFGALPDHYVVKANHGCGWNAFISPEDPLEPALLDLEMRRWMRRSFGKDLHEWAYLPIKRKVMVEEMLLFSNGQMANDVKFPVFDGRCEFVVYCDDRFGDHCWHHMTRAGIGSFPPQKRPAPSPCRTSLWALTRCCAWRKRSPKGLISSGWIFCSRTPALF
jgi:hypothetical protein